MTTTPKGTIAVGGDQAELDQLEDELLVDDAAAPKTPLPTDDDDDELTSTIEAKAEELAEHPERVELLEGLDAQDLADVCQLAFGLVADSRGPHWELPDKSAQRLGKWLKRVIDKHGLEWLKRWLPELATGIFLAVEVVKRLREDRRLAEKKKAEGPLPVRGPV